MHIDAYIHTHMQKTKMKRTSVMLTPEILFRLDHYLEDNLGDRSQIIREAINDWLDKYEWNGVYTEKKQEEEHHNE
jgi:metal-responsive CopG/Arc/MetJ family transcriptional regulator